MTDSDQTVEDALRALADDDRMPKELAAKLHKLTDDVLEAVEDAERAAYEEGYDEATMDAPTESEIRADILGDLDRLWSSVAPSPDRNCDWRRATSEPWASLAQMVSES